MNLPTQISKKSAKRSARTLQISTGLVVYATTYQVMQAPVANLAGSFGFATTSGDWNGDGKVDIAISSPWDQGGQGKY